MKIFQHVFLHLCMIIPCSSINYPQIAANMLVSAAFVCLSPGFGPDMEKSAPESQSEGQREPQELELKVAAAVGAESQIRPRRSPENDPNHSYNLLMLR